MAVTEDASAPAAVTSTTAVATTASFTPAAGPSAYDGGDCA